jgi:hypothetical protein
LRAALREKLDPQKHDGIISMHLIESDAALSRPLTDNPLGASPGAGDWFVLIDGTHVDALPVAHREIAALASGIQVSSGSYHLMWDLAKCDIPS